MQKLPKILKAIVLLSGSVLLFFGAAQAAVTLIPVSSATYDSAVSDYARAVAVDSSGNIIVSGAVDGYWCTIKYDPNLVMLSSATYDPDHNFDRAYAIAVDASDNIIVVGITGDPGNPNSTVIKYDRNLAQISAITYVGTNSGTPTVAVDASGNIIVTRTYVIIPNSIIYTVKYRPDLSGVLASAVHNYGTGRGVAVDPHGDIIVTGYTSGLCLIKYDENLVAITSATFAGIGYPSAMAVDASGNIIVAGDVNNGSWDYFVSKFDTNLVMLSSATYNSPWDGADNASSVAVDASGNIIVAGITRDPALHGDYFTIKYDPSLAVVLASATYDGGDDDCAYGVAADASGNIIVTGESNANYFTIKYNGAPPAIAGGSPASGEQGTTFDLTVTGSNFLPGAVAAISGTGISINSTTIMSRTLIKLNVTIADHAPVGDRDVTVTNTDATTVTVPRVFKVTPMDTKNVDSSAAAELRVHPESGEIKVGIAAGTFSQAVNVTVSTAAVPASTRPTIKVGNVCLEITNSLDLQPGKPVTITVNYRDADITGLDESKLALCRYDAANSLWIPLPTTVDMVNNVMTATTNHLSMFVLVQLAPAADLAGVKVYPNPFSPKNGSLTIANLTGEAEIKIYNVAGELVRSLSYTSANGRATWDGKNDDGNSVASGVYLAFIESSAGKKTIKIAVER